MLFYTIHLLTNYSEYMFRNTKYEKIQEKSNLRDINDLGSPTYSKVLKCRLSPFFPEPFISWLFNI